MVRHPLILAILLHNVVFHPWILRIYTWLPPTLSNSQLKPCSLLFIDPFYTSLKKYIPVWVSISDGHWKISIHFQKIREITSCTSEKKSDFHMGHVEIWFPHDPWRNHFELLLFDEFFGHAEIWFPHDQFSVKWATISPWVMWKSDFHMGHVEIWFLVISAISDFTNFFQNVWKFINGHRLY